MDLTNNKGYASRVFQVKLFAEDPNNYLYSFVMKIPKSAEEMPDINKLNEKMFEGQENKVDFWRLFAEFLGN